MRIAYVEDNPTNLALVERVVTIGQHKITSYTEGEIAVQALTREKFDLILMDIELAGDISGLQVVRSLRSFGLKTPIVAVTAYAMLGDRDKCIEAGCDDYLPKPIPIMDLVQLLARYDALVAEKRRTDEIKRKTDELKRKPDGQVASMPAATSAPGMPADSAVKPLETETKSSVAIPVMPAVQAAQAEIRIETVATKSDEGQIAEPSVPKTDDVKPLPNTP